MQLWEESERGFGARPDGCSLHIDSSELSMYIDSVYRDRVGNDVPDEYDRVLGFEICAFVGDSLFEKIKESRSVRLDEPSMRNLLSMEELIVKEALV